MSTRGRSRHRGAWSAPILLAVTLALLLFSVGCGVSEPAPAGTPGDAELAKVTRVVDGDTIHLAGLGSSRLIGVDTPETHGRGGEVECFGVEATAFAEESLVPGEEVWFSFGEEEQDQYGRNLVYVWLRDGTFLNETLVRDGYATALTVRPNDRFSQRFHRLADEARRLGRGLWADDACGRTGPSVIN